MNGSHGDPPRRAGLLLFALTLILAGAPVARGQQNPSVPEIPLTFRPPFAARYAGMGGAAIAFADDEAACITNPATLGLIRQIEFGVGFTHQKAKREVTFFGNTEPAEFGKTRLSHLGFAYPFPTYRGSLVVGGASARVSPLDSDFFSVGETATGLEREGIFQEGSLGAYSLSVAFQPTSSLYIGGTGTVLHGSNFYDRTFLHGANNFEQVQDYTMSGLTGTLGALARLGPGVRLGMVLYFPEGLDFDGTETDTFFLGTRDSTDVFDFTDQHIYLPYRLGGGVAITRRNLILAADAIYTDWTQIDFAGPLRLANRQFAYRQTVDVHAGVEFLLPTEVPVRLRAGYDLEPLPYRVVLTDVVNATYETAQFEQDRRYFTFGAGVLLAESLTLDVAYMNGGFKRTGTVSPPSIFREKEKDQRFLASLSLRLPFGRD